MDFPPGLDPGHVYYPLYFSEAWPLVWMSSPFRGQMLKDQPQKHENSAIQPVLLWIQVRPWPGVGSGQQGRISTSDQGCLWMEVDNVILPMSWYLLRTQRNRTPLKTPTRITSWDVDILVSLLDGFCFDFLPGKSDQGAFCATFPYPGFQGSWRVFKQPVHWFVSQVIAALGFCRHYAFTLVSQIAWLAKTDQISW